VDVQKPIEERPVGGLGLHLLKKVMDDVQYEYQDRESKITLVKKIGTQLKQN
jgi:anti-sigma regulatory factor (Ser/Thr protein kinase)